jgi:alkanesulfonate monooxygenase SsuD/methylene tetrahydromethanopterin reductase-like flavin-dependent oxidoreductase (luciferase family)
MPQVKFAIFDHIEEMHGTPTSQVFKDRLDLIRTADEAGFAGYHLAEHHGGGLCLAPGQEIFLAAAAQASRRMRLGPMVKLLPMHHPVKILEDMTILDQLTEGRLDFGVGRGPVPIEHFWYSHPWDEARARFDDTLAIIERALRTGEITSDGSRFYDFPPMPMQVTPYQERIPFWYPGNPVTAGRHGMRLMCPGRIDRESYDRYVENWHAHRNQPVRFDAPDDQPFVGYSLLLAIAPTEREAREVAQRGMNGLVRNTQQIHQHDTLVVSPEVADAAQGPLRAIMAHMDAAVAFGSGTSDQIAERLSALLEDGLCDYLCLMFPTGDMTIDDSRQTLDLFASEVMPRLQLSEVG